MQLIVEPLLTQTLSRDYIDHLASELLGIPKEELENVAREDIMTTLLSLSNLDPDKLWEINDGRVQRLSEFTTYTVYIAKIVDLHHVLSDQELVTFARLCKLQSLLVVHLLWHTVYSIFQQ